MKKEIDVTPEMIEAVFRAMFVVAFAQGFVFVGEDSGTEESTGTENTSGEISDAGTVAEETHY